MDVTVEPGNVYEYRIKVQDAPIPIIIRRTWRMRLLKEQKEIEAGEWTTVPPVACRTTLLLRHGRKPNRDGDHADPSLGR